MPGTTLWWMGIDMYPGTQIIKTMIIIMYQSQRTHTL